MTQHKQIIQRKGLVMRALAMALFIALFTQFAQAQQTLRMTNGTREVPDNPGFQFYDSGGPLIYTPGTPEADEYNWTTWYQHNEEYTLTLTNPDGGGIKIEFEKLLINNDFLSFYEGNTVDPSQLIGTFTNNDYSSAFCDESNPLIIESTGNMTIRFESDYHWRDEGWVATVTKTTSFTPRPPVAMLAACDNQMTLIPTCKMGSTDLLQYKIGDGAYQTYTPGYSVTLNSTDFEKTITTKATVGGVASDGKGHTFREIKDPSAPVGEPNASSNTVTVYFPEKPAGVNDTYYVRWIINRNSDSDNENPNLWPVSDHEFQQPSNTPHTVPAGEIDYTNTGLATPFYIHLATRGTTCPDNFSTVVSVEVDQIYVPKPTITFVTSGDTGATTFACSLEGATIYYTIDGSEPDPAHVGAPYPTSQYTTGNVIVDAGTTVKAVAVKSGFTNSAVASEIFIPGAENGNGQNGVYGNIVLLDDREDHSWSYYSDSLQPVHRLNPADVKITYKGYGKNTMTTTNTDDSNIPNSAFNANVTASQVKVNVNESGNEFVYLKTLENANDNGTGNYPYTMIPNPFSVRPKYDGGGGSAPTPTIDVTIGSGNSSVNNLPIQMTNNYSFSEQIFTASEIGSAGTIRTISFYKSAPNYDRSRTLVIYLTHTDKTSFTSDNDWVTLSNSNIVFSGTVNFPATNDWVEITLDTPFDYNGTSNLIVAVDDNSGQAAGSARSFRSYSTSANRAIYISGNTNYNPTSINTSGTRSTSNNQIKLSSGSGGGSSSSSNEYRGFYAWRVSSMSDGLIIKVGTREYTKDDITSGIILDAEQEIEFLTNNDYGNEVEFEALWAQAYVTTSNSTTGLHSGVSYERNFVVGATGITAINMPITYSSYYPDGTPSGTTSTVNGFTCSNNTKFENLRISGGTFLANNNYLCMGRGITGTATSIQGIDRYVSGTTNFSTLNYTLRIESGTYSQLAFVRDGTATVTGRYLVKAILGSDYDRANNKDNSKLIISQNNNLFYSRSVTFNSGSNVNQKTLDCVIKSGSYQSGYWAQNSNGDGDYTHSMYVGQNSSGGTYPGGRYVVIEGGEFGSVCGGRGVGNEDTSYCDPDFLTFSLRIKDAILNGSIYGGASDNPSIGSRRIVITGGTIKGWIAAGANGTGGVSGSSAQTIGNSYIYVGGNSVVGGANITVNSTPGGNIFGAGRGNTNQMCSVKVSNVVVADNTTIHQNVYGAGYNGYTEQVTNVYVLGGTVKEGVFGGGYNHNGNFSGTPKTIPTSNVYVKGGTVEGGVFGGSNSSGTVINSHVTMTGGTVSNVFGGGLGANTSISGTNASTTVKVGGGTVSNNVYGGGDAGTVTGITNVTVSGGTMKNVYGAGKGATNVTALITGQTKVNISGGTMNNVYGGGEAGNVDNGTSLASTVTIQGGTVNEDVFGGGRLGKTTGNVVVNVFDGYITGNVYGGAFGKREEVFIAGSHTVNITGGQIYTNVYGGSRNADDALSFNTSSSAAEQPVNRVNVSGGHVYYQVFAGGYFGHTYGSVYVFVGQNAINNAPNASPTSGVGYNAAALLIDGSVWAGADFGNFDGYSFGAATIEGYSNVYIDGTDYNTISTKPTDAGYMNIGGSILGSGTSCYAGLLGSNLIIRNYGRPTKNPDYSKEAIVEPYLSATRNLMSIQFFRTAVIDDTHIHLIGQGRINSLVTTEKYAIYNIEDILRMANGSSVFIDFPTDQMKRLGSYVCNDVYAATPSYTEVGIDDLDDNGKDNKFRVNNGSYLNIKYLGAYGTNMDYGELIGYFYMMTDDVNRTCAYARPKQSSDQGNQINTSYDNATDGGFLSYNGEYNTFTAGTLTGNVFASISDAPGTGTPGVQMPYENHTLVSNGKHGEQYFRIWRYGDKFSYRQGVLNAVAKNSVGYSTTDVVISLPAQHGTDSYFRIQSVNGFPMIDYGDDVMLVNAGAYNSTNDVPTTNGWMYYQPKSGDTPGSYVINQTASETHVAAGLSAIDQNTNANFGLVAIPQGSLAGGSNENWLICNQAGDENEALAQKIWTNNDDITNPSILFRLTYNNELTNNSIWDPIIITFEQVDKDGNVTDVIEIALSVSTVTTINQDFSGQAWAMMNGLGNQTDTYTAKVVLPGFIPFVNTEGDLSNWTFKSAVWVPEPGTTEFDNAWQRGSDYVQSHAANNMFSMQILPAPNFDNTVGWNNYDHTAKDLKTLNESAANDTIFRHLAYTDGRNSTAFDFILHFDGTAICNDTKKKMGELHVTLHFTNLKTSTEPDHGKDLLITIEVYRRGQGVNYYLDGVNGNNFFDGTSPNSAKKTLNGIFNRTEYTPGDNIFIVNTVTADGATALDWNGEQYGQVVLYRYPGGHTLNPSTASTEVFLGYDSYNPGNKGFTETLVKVERSMNMHGIVLDGAYDIAYGHPNASLAPEPATNYQTPTSPLVDIATNGTLTVYAYSQLRWNWTNHDGAAIYNAGVLNIRQGSRILNNKVLAETYNGGGVYVKNGATIIVSDSITINQNLRINKNNNVYLQGENSVIQVGTINPSDGLDALTNKAKIGVTKGAWPDYSYNPIAYSDGGGSTYLGNLIPSNPNDTPAEDYIIFDDDCYYKLVTLNNTPGYEPSSDYLFWVGTWVTAVRSRPDGFNPNNIDSPEDLAWAISVVNGLNGQTAAPATTFHVTTDIDMSANIWVPIGTSSHPYTGTFDAHGHVIQGIKSSLNEENMGMFGSYNSSKGAIQNMILNVSFTGGSSVTMGSVAAIMNEGVIRNVEAAGVITGSSSTTTMGGLVGQKEGGEIHSSFAANTMNVYNDNTNVGGLVGSNRGNLFNSYAAVTMGTGNLGNIGGLAGINHGTIENCYAVLGRQTFPAFAYQNNGTINICYADEPNDYVDNGNDPSGHGRYTEVGDRKDIGYMYYDNAIELESGESNDYVTDDIEYYKENGSGTRIEKWNGLLSSLNQWVNDGHTGYTSWFRPINQLINGDLPILGFPSDNCLGTTDINGKYLIYGSTENSANGLDNLLYTFNEKMEDAPSSLFLYGNATDVTRVPESQVKVSINENAVLLQAAGSGNFINATVGITFDNSCQAAHAYPGGDDAPVLNYDWHMLSTPLRDAKIGATYSHFEGDAYTPDAGEDVIFQTCPSDIASLTNSYFPNGLVGQNTISWDFYSFFEPEYHWVNLKRNKNNHFHQDAYEDVVQPGVPYQIDIVDQAGDSHYRHYQFEYTETDQSANPSRDDNCIFIPGKGYMMAISQDSYMSSTGTLNNGNVEIAIPLTFQSEQPKEKGFNLVGNPYQAYLDMTEFFKTNTALNNSYWVYVAEGDGYIAGNCTASTNYALPSVTLHPHQAFFVKTTEDRNAYFNYGMATADSAGFSYFRSARIDYPLVNLFVSNEQGVKDLTVIEANRPETDGTPKMRAMKTTNFELYTRTNGQDYSILFTEEGTERVAVGFKTSEDGTYTLKWDTQNGKFSYLQLIDNITGGQYDMLVTDHYRFEGHANDLTTRFYVVFKVDNGEDDMGDTFAFFNGNEWVINGKGTLQLIDVTGRILYSKNLLGETYSRAHFDNFAAGVYMLRLVENNNSIKSQKIIIE